MARTEGREQASQKVANKKGALQRNAHCNALFLLATFWRYHFLAVSLSGVVTDNLSVLICPGVLPV